MAEIVLSVTSKVAEYLVAPVGRRCGSAIFYNSYFRQLEDELEELENARHGVQRSIDEARTNMKEIETHVERWVEDVETVASKARDVLEHYGRAKKTCFCGWLPNPKARYCLGRDARNTVQAIQTLILQSKFETVYYEGAPPGLVAGAPVVNSSAGDGGDSITDSRASIFQGIMKALDDEKLKVIGIYGPGGVGKTTLLQELEEKLRKEGRPFHMIVKSKVSQTPDLNKIQDDITYALGLNLRNEPSEEGRRDILCKRLQRDPSEKILIILDDLWDKLDLKAVGIPSGDESGGCQVLLTSRYKDVLQQKMRASPVFHLKGLNNDEAFRLFEKTVGDKLKDEESKEIAAKVVQKLGGLPLLILSVASTLKDRDVDAWRNALIKIDYSKMETSDDLNFLMIETSVKLSYGHLESEDAKSLFLLCSLIGGTIQVKTLLELSLGLGLFEAFNNTIQSSRDRLNTMLDSLRSIDLLQDDGDDEEYVTVNDLYSEVVVSTPFRGQNSLMMNNNYGSWPKEKLEKCWAICLANVGSDMLDKLRRCRFPDLKILMLSQSKEWIRSPAHQYDVKDCRRLDFIDFTYMKELRVLYLHSMHITTLPSSIEILMNLRSLHLDFCDMEDVAIIGELKALKILSFAGSAICRLPKEIGELTLLRSLNLSNCNMLQIIEPGALKGLINLEEVDIKGSFDRLEILIRDPTIPLQDGDLPFENLIRLSINIENVAGRTIQGLKTIELKVEECDNILSREWVRKTLHKSQYFHLDVLTESNKIAHELCTEVFGQLKHLNILNNPSIKYIAYSSEGLSHTAFTILESLFLENLINLEEICHDPIAPECFSKLEVMGVKRCHRLKNLWCLSKLPNMTNFCIKAEITSKSAPIQVVFPFQRLKTLDVSHCDELSNMFTMIIAENLVELTKLRISNCKMLTEIISDEGGKEELVVTFKQLKHMELEDLIGLTCFSSSRCTLMFPLLEDVIVTRCLNVKFFSNAPIRAPKLKRVQESTNWWFSNGSIRNITQNMPIEMATVDGVEFMHMSGFSELTEKWHNKFIPIKSSWQLKSLVMDDCPFLNAIPSRLMLVLDKINTLQVQDCLLLEEIFDLEELEATKRAWLLPQLWYLNLVNLPKLRQLWNKDLQGTLHISSLSYLTLYKCHSIRHAFTPSMAQCLPTLQWMEIKECDQMEGVIAEEEGKRSAVEKITFPILHWIELERLPKLTNFLSDKNHTLECPILQELTVAHSPKIITFTWQSLMKIDRGIHSPFTPQVLFPQVKSMVLSHMDNSSNIWVDDVQHLHKVKTLDKLRVEFCVT